MNTKNALFVVPIVSKRTVNEMASNAISAKLVKPILMVASNSITMNCGDNIAMRKEHSNSLHSNINVASKQFNDA